MVLKCGRSSAITQNRAEATGSGHGLEEYLGRQPGRLRCTRPMSLIRANRVTMPVEWRSGHRLEQGREADYKRKYPF